MMIVGFYQIVTLPLAAGELLKGTVDLRQIFGVADRLNEAIVLLEPRNDDNLVVKSPVAIGLESVAQEGCAFFAWIYSHPRFTPKAIPTARKAIAM